jgi:hypothetical protein
MSGRSSATAEQLVYYRAVAGEYEDHTLDVPGQDELLSAIDSFRPTGDVLEAPAVVLEQVIEANRDRLALITDHECRHGRILPDVAGPCGSSRSHGHWNGGSP